MEAIKCEACGSSDVVREGDQYVCQHCGTAFVPESAYKTDVTEYKCPNCGAPLHFHADSGKVHCDSCGNDFEIEDVKALYQADSAEGEEFDWSKYKLDATDTLDDVRVFLCESCGAQIEADQTTAATKCPYCGNNVVLDERVGGGLKPNYIIPFKFGPQKLPEMIRKFYKGKALLPRRFFEQNEIGKAQGIYVPFWLFDSKIDGNVTMNGELIRHYTQGDYDCTETNHFLLIREGSMAFAKIPVDASVKMPNDLMDSIEPFDYSELVEFDPAYLTGYLADRFDSDPDAEIPRANERMQNSAVDMFLSTAAGFAPRVRSSALRMLDASVGYVLLPVYLLNCKYRGETYQYAVNGQTGKVVGDLPVSKGKWWTYFLSVAVGAAAVLFGLASVLLK